MCECCLEEYFKNPPERSENVKMNNGKMKMSQIYLIKFKCHFCKEEHSMEHSKYLHPKDNENKCCVIY